MSLTIESQRTTLHQTFSFERHFAAPPERVFAAFADPAKKRQWYAEHAGMQTERFEMDFRIGGTDHTTYRTAETSPLRGARLSNCSFYQDIVPKERIVTAYTMSVNDAPISASQATFEFYPAEGGTRLVFTDQGAYFEGADGPEMREAGWGRLLDSLAVFLN